MATWTNEVTTSSGGNISMVISGGYGTVTRTGSSISFNWGVRFKQATTTYTYNSICARPGGTNYYALKSEGGVRTYQNTWYYATSTSNKVLTAYTAEATPFTYSGTAGSVNGGSITISVGTAWNGWTPEANLYTYKFSVPYPAATAYSVTYNANGGSGAPGSQTKYQGYTLTLQSGTPSRSGYAFSGWSGSDGKTYYAGNSFTGNYNLTLTAIWTPTNPIFSAPSLTATETTLSWGTFSINTSSNVYYQLDSQSGSWTHLASNTLTGPSATISKLSPGTSHTVYFRVVNAADTASATIHSSSKTLYNYPYITNIGNSTINVGETQTIDIYNPLNRNVTLSVSKVGSTTQTFSSTNISASRGYLSIPVDSIAPLIPNNTSHSTSIVYTSDYSGHLSTAERTVNLSASVGAPTIDTSKQDSFIEIGDIGTFTLGSSNYNMSNATGSTSKYLQGQSKLRYKLLSNSNPFSSKYGSTIANYSVSINSKSATATVLDTQYYEGSTGGTISSSDAVVMSNTYTYTLAITATDTRGFTNSYNKTFTVYPYSAPSLGTPQIIRDDGFGTKTTLTVSGSWCPNMTGIHFAKKIVLYYKAVSASSYSTYTLYEDSGSSTAYKSLSETYSLSELSFDSDVAYNIYVQATDCFNQTTSSVQGNLPLGVPLLFIDAAMKGIGVNCFPAGEGIYPAGKEIDSSNPITNTYPGRLFGSGIQIHTVYKGNAPADYGNLINIGGQGQAQLFLQWSEAQTTTSHITGHIWYRSWRDSNAERWSDWAQLVDTKNALDLIYPKGSVYLSVQNVSPASFIGGDWNSLPANYYLKTTTSSGGSSGGDLNTSVSSGTTGSTTLTASQSGLRQHDHTTTVTIPQADFWIRHGSGSGVQTVAAGHQTSIGVGWGETWNNGFSVSSYAHNLDAVIFNLTPSASTANAGNWNATEGHTHSMPSHSHTINPTYYCVYAWRRIN